MARLGQPIGESSKGGGIAMIEDALTVIENYLNLVRAFLPDEIGPDVIDELRSYIIEAAEEEGGGHLTVESAKRTVARFGAPSEVAEEYKESMMLEESEETSLSPDMVAVPPPSPIESHEPTEEISTSKRETYNFNAWMNFVLVSLIWICITSIAGGYSVFLLLPSQAALITVFGLVVLGLNELNGQKPLIRSYDDWPVLQRVTTFPDRFLPKQGDSGLTFELIITIVAGITFAFSAWFILATPFLMGRIYIISKRFKDTDPVSYAKKDAVIEFLNIVVLNFLFGITISLPTSIYYYSLMPVSLVLGFLLSTHMIIRLTALTPDLWVKHEVAAVEAIAVSSKKSTVVDPHSVSEPEEIYEEPLVPDERVRRGKPASYTTTALKGIAISLVWAILIPFLVYPFTLTYYNLFDILTYMVIFVGIIQIPALVGLQLGNIARAKRKDTILWDESNRTWSWLRKALTLPKGTFLEQATFILRIDMFVTFILVIASLYASTIYQLPGVIVYALLAFAMTMGIRFILLDDRWRNPVERKYDKLEFLMNILILGIGTFILIGFFGFGEIWESVTWLHYNLQQPFTVIWAFLSIYLLFSTVARGNTLWSSAPDEKESKETKSYPKHPIDRDSALESLKIRREQTIKEIFGWNTLMGITIGIFYLFTLTELSMSVFVSYVFTFFVVISVISMIGCIYAEIYYIWRKSRIADAKIPSVIGRKGRFEAFIDFVATAVVLGFILYNLNYMGYLNSLFYNYSNYLTSISPEYIAPVGVMGGIYFSLLISAPVIRLLSLIGTLIDPSHSFPIQLKQYSGVLSVVAIGVIIGLILPSSTSYLQIDNFQFIATLVVLSVYITLQTITSKFKLEDRRATPTSPERNIVIEDLGHGEIEIPVN